MTNTPCSQAAVAAAVRTAPRSMYQRGRMCARACMDTQRPDPAGPGMEGKARGGRRCCSSEARTSIPPQQHAHTHTHTLSRAAAPVPISKLHSVARCSPPHAAVGYWLGSWRCGYRSTFISIDAWMTGCMGYGGTYGTVPMMCTKISVVRTHCKKKTSSPRLSQNVCVNVRSL
jgi:hypothetical protein